MSSVVKAILGIGLALMSCTAMARDIYVLVVGDESAASCHSRTYGPVPGIYQLGLDGQERQAADPLDWSDCHAGSIWMPLAARLKRQQGVGKVVLMSVGVSGARAQDFSTGPAATRLHTALSAAKQRGIHFDYALWQQGFPDRAMPENLYLKQMQQVIKATSLDVDIDRWLIGSEGCARAAFPGVAKAQAEIAKQIIFNRFAGPIDMQLDRQAQLPDCRLTAAGQEIMAQYWFDAIKRADLMDSRYEQEALISLFK
jgi:hypothetical protein